MVKYNKEPLRLAFTLSQSTPDQENISRALTQEHCYTKDFNDTKD